MCICWSGRAGCSDCGVFSGQVVSNRVESGTFLRRSLYITIPYTPKRMSMSNIWYISQWSHMGHFVSDSDMEWCILSSLVPSMGRPGSSMLAKIGCNKEARLHISWWRHQMETISPLLAFCAGNSPVSGEFPAQRRLLRRFGVFFVLCLNKALSKQSWGWWFETPSCSLWRHRNILKIGLLLTGNASSTLLFAGIICQVHISYVVALVILLMSY